MNTVNEVLIQVADWKALSAGSVFIRINEEKEQQGLVHGINESGDGIIVTDVVDLKIGEFLTEAGIIKPGEEDKIYTPKTTFKNHPEANRAREIVRAWSLFTKNPALQTGMMQFVEHTFYPDQIFAWKSEEQLQKLFIPLQQKFKIGKYAPKVDHEKELAERFGKMLGELYDGKHLTYVAFIPREANKPSRFYSIGTKPHLETKGRLKDEPGGFNPNQGGHIKIISKEDELPKKFLVDAGSYDLGSGMHTSLAIAELVTEGMKRIYPEYEFVPVAGRGAQGVLQSY